MSLHSTDPTLYALFCLRRHTLAAHSGTLGRLTGRSATQTALDLLQLESLGLVDASSARLTMLGLARAAQLARASGDRARRGEVGAQPQKALRQIKPPVAAQAQHTLVDDDDDANPAPEALSA